ncbi:Rne/Rng family ribonuclease [bacterium]|nr:Rne/Rng family ribonuclease [bacterium]
MLKKIIVNDNFYETRIALTQQGGLWEYFQEKKEQRTLVGNIYKGKVLRVLPGLQSAFIDIGYEKAAFLHVSDLLEQHLNEDDNEIETTDISQVDISQMLSQGEEIIVQVSKDPISTKGPRVTTWLSIPGRYLVFFPIGNKVGVSKKIESESERKRLKDIVENIKPEDTTFVIRTVAEGVSQEILQSDMELTMRLWIDIVKKQKDISAPFPLHEDLSMPLRIARDLLNNDIEEMIIDNMETYKRVLHFVEHFMPLQKEKIKHFDSIRFGSIFEKYGIEKEIDLLYHKSVPLKSGGNIIIEQVEAMTIVDVNTGSFVGKNLEHSDTILRTNKEAIEVLANQLRLRNIGGIIIVDCIDMKSDGDREDLINFAESVTSKDRAKVIIHSITSLGLMQITRKRISDSFRRNTTHSCPICRGLGFLKSPETITHEIYRDILKIDSNLLKDSNLKIVVSPHIYEYLISHEEENIKKLKEQIEANIDILLDSNFSPENFTIGFK